MQFNLTIEMDNDAFLGRENIELAQILQALSYKLQTEDSAAGIIRDTNGNSVGLWEIRK